MSLGHFYLGNKITIPLQVLEGGSASTSDILDVKVQEVIMPDLSKDSNFPQSMNLISKDRATYSLDYSPKSIGNYIAIITLSINSIVYSQMESFYVSQGTFLSDTAPMAKSISSYTPHSSSEDSTSSDASSDEDKDVKKVIVQEGLVSAAPSAKPVK